MSSNASSTDEARIFANSETSTFFVLAACCCFFLTGLVALVYEICWVRKACLAFGSTTWAVSAVLAIFFGGLALGSLIVGRYSRHVKRPLRLFGVLELGVGVAAILSPTLFEWTDRLYGVVYSHALGSVILLTLTRLAMVSLVILPATILMGGSLPLFCQQFVRRERRVSRGVGLLYGLNTLGAAVGAAWCGLWLIPELGVNTSIYLAGGVNLAVGAFALWLSRRPFSNLNESRGGNQPAGNRQDSHAEWRGNEQDSHAGNRQDSHAEWRGNEQDSHAESDGNRQDSHAGNRQDSHADSGLATIARSATTEDLTGRFQPRPRLLAFLFFGVGLVALGNEVLWTRFLSLLMPNTVHTYTMTLSVVLLGIVVGSWLAAFISHRSGWQALVFGAAQVFTGLTVMTVLQLRPQWWGSWLSPISVGQQLGVVFAVLLTPAVLSGMSFPLAVGLISRDASQTGWDAGRMAALNMFGGIAGSLLVGFLALPALGMQQTLFLTTGVSVLIGVAAWWVLLPGTSVSGRIALTLASVASWMAIPYYAETRLPRDFLATGGALVDYREGISDNVALLRDGDLLRLEVNRMWQGQNRKNHQIMAAHVPAILHPNPQSVLVIGLGTGQTAGRFLFHDIGRLDCLEIEDGMVELVANHFDAQWMRDPRFHVIVEDGRNYVTHTRQQYDIISIEVGQIYRPGVASFYTLDFYRQLRERLRPKGLACQFLPIDFFGPEHFRTLVATFLEVFPESVLWYNTSELLLIGANGPQATFDPHRFRSLMAENQRLQQDLQYAYWGGSDYYLWRPEVFLAGFLANSSPLRDLSQDASRYRDDRPYLEYIPLARHSRAHDIVPLLLSHLSPMSAAVGGDADAHPDLDLAHSERVRRQNLLEMAARPAIHRGRELEATGQAREAMLAYYEALDTMPEHPRANFYLAGLLQSQGRTREAIAAYRRALTTRPDDVRTLYDLAVALQSANEIDEAMSQWRRLLEVQPDDFDANFSLGVLLQESRNLAEAAEFLDRAAEAVPTDLNVLLRLASLRQELGQLQEALMRFEQARRLAPQAHPPMIGAAWILATHPDPSQRDPRQAIDLAQNAARSGGSKDPRTADVLAAAYAAEGQFELAIETAELALQLANNAKNEELSRRIEERLSRYRQGLPVAP